VSWGSTIVSSQIHILFILNHCKLHVTRMDRSNDEPAFLNKLKGGGDIEGPIRATRGGGSEWEPIKILPFG
jgi:hypothetical protein